MQSCPTYILFFRRRALRLRRTPLIGVGSAKTPKNFMQPRPKYVPGQAAECCVFNKRTYEKSVSAFYVPFFLQTSPKYISSLELNSHKLCKYSNVCNPFPNTSLFFEVVCGVCDGQTPRKFRPQRHHSIFAIQSRSHPNCWNWVLRFWSKTLAKMGSAEII